MKIYLKGGNIIGFVGGIIFLIGGIRTLIRGYGGGLLYRQTTGLEFILHSSLFILWSLYLVSGAFGGKKIAT